MGSINTLTVLISSVFCTLCFAGKPSVVVPDDASSIEPAIVGQVDDLLQVGLADSAVRILKDQLASTERKKPPDQQRRAYLLSSLADCQCQLLQLGACDSLRAVADSLWLAEFGLESLEAARSQLSLGETDALAGHHDRALEHFAHARRLILAILGPRSLDLAIVMRETARSQQYLNHYAEAEQNLLASLDILLESEVPCISDIMKTSTALSWTYHDTLPARADSLLTQALILADDNPSSLRLERSDVLFCMGAMQLVQGRLSRAEQSLAETLKLKTSFYGESHPDIASAQGRLAQVYRKQARLEEAQSHLKGALATYEQFYDPNHPMVAYELVSLALVYKDQGKYSDAEANINRALAIVESNFGKDHPGIGTLSHNLAEIYRVTGRLDKAKKLFQEVLEHRRQRFGIDAAISAPTLHKLGLAYFETGDQEEAESLLTRALEVEQRSRGSLSVTAASPEVSLARLYYLAGRYADARELADRALAVYQGSLAPTHPRLTDCMMLLGALSAELGEHRTSKDYFADALQRRHSFVSDVYAFACTDQKSRYLAEYPLVMDVLLDCAVQRQDSALVRIAFEMVLNGKAKIVDVLATEARSARCSRDDRINQVAASHAQICTDISAFSYDAALNIKPEIMRQRLDHLYSAKDSLESVLSSWCVSLTEQLGPQNWISTSDVAESLPTNAQLLEFVKYVRPGRKGSLNAEDNGVEERYILFVIDSQGDSQVRDIGDASSLDRSIESIRDIISTPGPQIYSDAGKLYEEQLFRTSAALREILIPPDWDRGTADRQLFIVPDGMLNLLPFEVLADRDGTYLIEQVPICYLTSGRALLALDKTDSDDNARALVLADPSFGGYQQANLSDQTGENGSRGRSKSKDALRGGPGSCIEGGFTPLPGTAREAQLVADHLEQLGKMKVKTLLGVEACELSLIAELPGLHILHIATHSFFCGQAEASADRRLTEALVRSGFALAGANLKPKGQPTASGESEDGILTALEIAGLNLDGTELVVLSSCQSGVGQVVDCEGMFGLRCALQAAGARSSVVSLWNVPDAQATQFMDHFYSLWLSGASKTEAHRQTSRRLLDSARSIYGHGHPLLWGGFVVTGDPY